VNPVTALAVTEDLANAIMARRQKLNQQSSMNGDNYRHRLVLGLILSLIAFLLYVNTLNHRFVLDDGPAITENHTVKQGVKGIPDLLKTDYRAGAFIAKGTLYRPLSLVMFAIEWQFFPDNPLPGHLINVFLYALTGYLLFTLLNRLMPGTSLLIAFSITLLFIVHPIHTEVIANIKSRDEILSFLFVLAALHLSVRNTNIGTLIVAGTCYFFSLMSKESSITIVAVVPVLLYFFTDMPRKKIFVTTAVFVFAASAYLILRRVVLGEISGISDVPPIDNFLVLANDFNSKTATAMEILGKYLQLMFFPHPLSIDYAYNQIPIVNWANYKPLLSVSAYLGMIVLALFRIQKKELWVFGIIFYLITMSLYTNLFITIGSGFGERFLYVPCLGFCIAIVALLAKLWKFSGQPQKLQ